MDEFDHPFDAGEDLGPFTILSCVIAFTLCMATCLLSLSRISQIGPDVGTIVTFDPREGPKHWDQPGFLVQIASARRECVLLPSVIAASGGSFVIESKETTRPPVFRVHWSGFRTDSGAGNCGRSADLTLALNQLRALANFAGGFGVEHGFLGR